MRIIRSVSEMNLCARRWHTGGRRTGLVPTMGALHAGHHGLLDLARPRCDMLVASLFVNPTQFDSNADLERYPRAFEADAKACQAAGVDVLFAPPASEMYPPGFTTWVDVPEIGARYEGEARPGHFRGVCTVVLKLFEITQPGFAVFGHKDAQQLALIRRMVRDLGLPVRIVAAPTVREADGLAVSSRNRFLSPQQRARAPVLYRALQRAAQLRARGERSSARLRQAMRKPLQEIADLEIDYADVVDPERFQPVEEAPPGALLIVAARLGRVRLIDNLTLSQESAAADPRAGGGGEGRRSIGPR
ncbi:MAG: pantoate--beta-alanine ligase [Acidobacteriota bacterium]